MLNQSTPLSPLPSRRRRSRPLALAVIVSAAVSIAAVTTLAEPSPPPVAAQPTPGVPSAPLSPSPAATPTSAPTPVPTPAIVPAPLTGRPVTADVASRRVLTVMVDDHPAARPQAGFNAASVVWHAPAEAGIPRYMLMFQDEDPVLVGPVRSARQYFIAWAAEWRPVFAHVGGSPQAMQTLRESGQGQLVYDADEMRWGGEYLWRTADRPRPHNVYTDGSHLRDLAGVLGATDDLPVGSAAGWRFGPEVPPESRPVGGSIHVPYPENVVNYRYDRATDRYIRSVEGASPQVDAADGRRVAPANVVVLSVAFRPLDDGHPEKGRLEADVIGEGTALIASHGETRTGTWRKASIGAPLQLLDEDGAPATLAVGQTFIQVVPTGTDVRALDGAPPAP